MKIVKRIPEDPSDKSSRGSQRIRVKIIKRILRDLGKYCQEDPKESG